MKPKLVIFEGADKSGKSTLYKAFRERTTWGPLAIERFIGSNIVYDIAYHRHRNNEDLLKAEKELLKVFDVRLVYCEADPAVINGRIRYEEKGEQKKRALENYLGVMHYYREYYLPKTPFPYIVVRTDSNNIQEALKQVLKFVGGN